MAVLGRDTLAYPSVTLLDGPRALTCPDMDAASTAAAAAANGSTDDSSVVFNSTILQKYSAATSPTSAGNAIPSPSNLAAGNNVPGTGRSRSVSRGQRGKRGGPTFAQAAAKKPKQRQDHPFKMDIWQKADGKKAAISLAAWQQMDTLLCISAADKVRSQGPPKGGIGMKNWIQHTHPGSEQSSQLPPEERFGHAILRFSTIDAQDWYRPLVQAALGTDQEGNLMKLDLDAESDDDRARYSASLLNSNFITFGDTEEERTGLLMKIILAAIGIGKPEECGTLSSRILHTEGKDDLWSIGIKFPPVVETGLDKILLGQRYGILPTAICPVRFLKQRGTVSAEEKLVSATNKMMIPGPGKSLRKSSGSTPQPGAKAPLMEIS